MAQTPHTKAKRAANLHKISLDKKIFCTANEATTLRNENKFQHTKTAESIGGFCVLYHYSNTKSVVY